MRSARLLLPALLALCSHSGFAAEEEPFHVTASVYWNDRLVMTADMVIPRGREAVEATRGNLRLEIQPARSASENPQLTVRLIDISREMPRVLHTSRTPDPPAMARSLMYSICGDRVMFRSPAPLQPTSCGA